MRLGLLGCVGLAAFAANHAGLYKVSSLLAVLKHAGRLLS